MSELSAEDIHSVRSWIQKLLGGMDLGDHSDGAVVAEYHMMAVVCRQLAVLHVILAKAEGKDPLKEVTVLNKSMYGAEIISGISTVVSDAKLYSWLLSNGGYHPLIPVKVVAKIRKFVEHKHWKPMRYKPDAGSITGAIVDSNLHPKMSLKILDAMIKMIGKREKSVSGIWTRVVAASEGASLMMGSLHDIRDALTGRLDGEQHDIV